jgi:hypothetical protein
MLGLSPWLSPVVVLVVALLVRRLPVPDRIGRRAAASARWLATWRWTPLVAGALTGLATWYVWGSLARSAVVHDESAYLLQAELFARGRFTAPTPPLPQFFEQLYVNLVPALSSKYPPGTSLMLVPGVLIGIPGLPVILMNALTGALVFALARQIAGGFTSLLAWALWSTSFPVLYFHAMYLSEVPSGLAWLAAWWGVVRWRSSGKASDVAITAAALALCGITRPLTAAALAISIGGAMLLVASRRTNAPARLQRRELGTIAVGAALAMMFVALWSWRSTGDLRVTPLALYTRTHVPFDGLGFGARDADAPSARIPWDQRVTNTSFYLEHRRHTPSTLPATAVRRARMIGRDMWYDWRGGLALVALVGLVGAPVELWIGLGALAIQLLLYLLYAHPATWSLYYMEGLPVLAVATALGVAQILSLGTRRRAPARTRLLAAAVLMAALAYPSWVTLRQVRAQIATDHAFYDAFRESLPTDADSAIVFVRYTRTHNDGLSLVRNVPNLHEARVWTVYDRGAENAKLLSAASGRRAYLFDEASWTVRPLARADAAGNAPAQPARSACVLAPDDSAWTANALRDWNRLAGGPLHAPVPVDPILALYDAHCAHTLTPAAASGGGTTLKLVARPFVIASAEHGGTVRLPNGDSLPAHLASFAAPLPGGGMFLAMALPAIWRAEAKGERRDLLATAVFMHEFTHTQSRGLGARVDSLVAKGLPSDADDDVVQTRFAERPGFRAAYEAERDALYAVASATNDATAAASARRALALMDRRRAKFYQGPDALYTEAEDLFLTMEGMGQWAAYLWLVDPAGGAMSRADALTFIRRGGRRWSQDEGLALLLALSRLDSASPAALFERAPATATMLLRRALTQPR